MSKNKIHRYLQSAQWQSFLKLSSNAGWSPWLGCFLHQILRVKSCSHTELKLFQPLCKRPNHTVNSLLRLEPKHSMIWLLMVSQTCGLVFKDKQGTFKSTNTKRCKGTVNIGNVCLVIQLYCLPLNVCYILTLFILLFFSLYFPIF